MFGDNMKDCIFCKIVKGELPSLKVYEDKDVLAFLDIMAVNKGHTLVIPKKHYYNIEDTPEELVAKVMAAVKKVAPAVKKAADTDGFVVMQCNGETGGQVIPHLHFHIIPRLKDDGLKSWPQAKYAEGEREKYCTRILKEME